MKKYVIEYRMIYNNEGEFGDILSGIFYINAKNEKEARKEALNKGVLKIGVDSFTEFKFEIANVEEIPSNPK